MSSWSDGQRPLTLAILALGGEGGGVLADWIVATSERAGFYAQNTSVAGVAQRTGATVYYVEMLPPTTPTNGGGPPPVRSEPVMSIFPTPGEVDVVIASELMESGRAIQRGFSTADRTTLITSTNRVYSIDEKVALGDGRVDDTKLLQGAQRGSKRLIAADFADLAEQTGSVISASLFGALAGSGALPFTREQFEDSIKASGKGVEASLAAFAAGFDVATTQAAPPEDASEEAVAGSQKVDPVTPRLIELPLSGGASSSRSTETTKAGAEAERNRIAATDPASLVGPGLRDLAEQVRGLPAAARSMILHGLVRTAVFQDRAYAEHYLQRVHAFAAVDPDPDGDARLTREAARHIALWMCYQDTIQVAAQKVRMRRMDRIRQEAKVRDNQLMQVREFLHPQIDEIVDTLPTWLGEPLSRSQTFRRIVRVTTHKGMILNTNSVVGYTLLTTMALVRPLRPRSVRFVREQAAIEGWIAQALEAAGTDPDLATEIIECQRVLKGYGSTWEHGNESFAVLMDAARRLLGTPGAAVRLADLREAALADEDGALLQAKAGALQPA
jgi:indolepyruvate ferredoxin oxidoreductase beta subunit